MSALDAYLTHLTVERRLAANSIESYARDLQGLAAFAVTAGREAEALSRQDLERYHNRGYGPRVFRSCCFYWRFLRLR